VWFPISFLLPKMDCIRNLGSSGFFQALLKRIKMPLKIRGTTFYHSLKMNRYLVAAQTILLTFTGTSHADLILTGILDGGLTGGLPKGVEVFVTNDIPDLSIFGIDAATNGGGTDGQEFTFPAVAATKGEYIYVGSEATGWDAVFGVTAYTDGDMAINGDDAIELFKNGTVIDTFGDINLDGSNQSWEYLDSFAYRVNATGPDGTTFVEGNWSFDGRNILDGLDADGHLALFGSIFGNYAPLAQPFLSLSITGGSATFAEDAATITVTVSVAPSGSDLQVDLSSNGDGTEITVDSAMDISSGGSAYSVTILDGQTSTTFDVNALDDGRFDGTQTVTYQLMRRATREHQYR